VGRFTGEFTAREKWSLALSGVFLSLGALLTPPAHVSVVDGHIVREMVLFGYIVPKWLAISGLAAALLILSRGFMLLFGRIWPETTASTTTRRDQNGDRTTVADNVSIQREVPPDPPAPEYVLPVFTLETTAAEFLAAEEEISVLDPPILGEGFAIWMMFWECREWWLVNAPDSELKNLISEAEKIFAGPNGAWCMEIGYCLRTSHEMRGIPTFEELYDLGHKIKHREIGLRMCAEFDSD
jgi:hypothetical protein